VSDLLSAALAYCARCDEVAELKRAIMRHPDCEKVEPFDPDDLPIRLLGCADALTAASAEGTLSIPWWEATPEQIAAFCRPCQGRVALRRERHRLRRTVSGLKTALMRAYRAEAKTDAA